MACKGSGTNVCSTASTRDLSQKNVLRCDADPNTLAEYVIALLKAESENGLSEEAMRPVLRDQLNEFVEGQLQRLLQTTISH